MFLCSQLVKDLGIESSKLDRSYESINTREDSNQGDDNTRNVNCNNNDDNTDNDTDNNNRDINSDDNDSNNDDNNSNDSNSDSDEDIDGGITYVRSVANQLWEIYKTVRESGC
jgi:hypothetical protein